MYRYKSSYISSTPLGSKGVQTYSVIQTTLLVNYNRYSLGNYYSLFLVQWNIQESVHSWVNTNLLLWETERTYYDEKLREHTLHYTKRTYYTLEQREHTIH